jgi:hypothetical protein
MVSSFVMRTSKVIGKNAGTSVEQIERFYAHNLGDRKMRAGIRSLHHHFIALLLLVVGSAPVRADDNYYNCVVVQHLHLTEEGYTPHPHPYPPLGTRFTINKQSGAVVGIFDLANFQWERIRVVKTSPDYNIFMTRGYASDGTPAKEVVVDKGLSGVTQFVSIDVLSGLEVLDGTCK